MQLQWISPCSGVNHRVITPGRGKGLTGATGSSQRDEKGIRPSVTASRRYPAASVIHVRFAVHPSSPWRGVSPLEWARCTGQLGANLETRLGEGSSGPVGYLLPVPQDSGDGSADDPLAQLKSDLAKLGGGISLVETTAGGWGEGRGSSPADATKFFPGYTSWR